MHEIYMNMALEEAKKAYDKNEVPVGAIIVHKGEVIARAHNLREAKHSSLSHAEIEAIKQANEVLGTWMLNECTLYVTLEPCIMCAGACIQSRVGTVVFGAYDPKGGSFGSSLNLLEVAGFNHYPNVIVNLNKESEDLLKRFFREIRENKMDIKQVRTMEALDGVLALRNKVFVIEQNVDPSLEYDELDILDDEKVVHFAAIIKDEVVGTMRLIKEGDVLKVGRVAVSKEHRNANIGTRLMAFADAFAFNNGFNTLKLGAQVRAVPFYESCGYSAYGDIFLDANIDHIMMKKKAR